MVTIPYMEGTGLVESNGPLGKATVYKHDTHAQITKIHTQKMTGRTKSSVCPVNLGCVGKKSSRLIDQPTHNSIYNSNK